MHVLAAALAALALFVAPADARIKHAVPADPGSAAPPAVVDAYAVSIYKSLTPAQIDTLQKIVADGKIDAAEQVEFNKIVNAAKACAAPAFAAKNGGAAAPAEIAMPTQQVFIAAAAKVKAADPAITADKTACPLPSATTAA